MRHRRIAPVHGAMRVKHRRWLLALLVAAVMATAAPGVLAAAATRIGINGGRPSDWPILSSVLASQGLTQERWLDFASRVGENWLPGTKPIPLDYPGQLGFISGPNALSGDQSTEIGQTALDALIRQQLQQQPGVPIVVAGLSEGTLVIDRELDYLSANPAGAPGREQLSFVVFGDMRRGLGQMYFPGVSVPIFGYTFKPVTETKYDVSVVIEQWDGWANPPDRPWNLIADLNALMGAVYTVDGSNDHSQTSLDSLSDAVVVSTTPPNSLGGTTTTYMVPKADLPLTRPLSQLGVPSWAVAELNKLLMPIIHYGYSVLTPELGPRVENGQLVFTPPSADAVAAMKPVKDADYGAPLPAADVNAVASTSADLTATANGTSRLNHAATQKVIERVSPEAVLSGAGVPETTEQALSTPESVDSGSPVEVDSTGADPEPAASTKDETQSEDPEKNPLIRTRHHSGLRSTDAKGADEGGTVKPRTGPDAVDRGRPGRVRASENADTAANVHDQAKPGGTTPSKTDDSETSSHDGGAAA